MLVVSAKSNLGCAAGCGLTGSFSDHSRIGRALQMTFQLFSGTTCSRKESPVEHERGARCMKDKLRYVMVDTNHRYGNGICLNLPTIIALAIFPLHFFCSAQKAPAELQCRKCTERETFEGFRSQSAHGLSKSND